MKKEVAFGEELGSENKFPKSREATLFTFDEVLVSLYRPRIARHRWKTLNYGFCIRQAGHVG